MNREKYLARREKFSAEEEDKNAIEEQINHSTMEIKRDFYLNEVLQIAVDYTQALGSEKFAKNN